MDGDPQDDVAATRDAGGHLVPSAAVEPPAAAAAFDVFISYSHADGAAAQRLWAALTAVGLRAYKDDREIRSGDRWLSAIEQAVGRCRAFVVLVGRDGVQRWVGAEVEVALNRHLSPRDAASGPAARLPIHPVLLAGGSVEAIPPFLALFQAVAWPEATADPPATLITALKAHRAPAHRRLAISGCPWVGLGAYQSDQSDRFFGRRAETLAALACLGDQNELGPDRAASGGARFIRWLQIHGHSGSGKSSLVRAGLLPMIARGALWPRTGWEAVQLLDPIKPGAKPLEQLAVALERALVPAGTPRDSLAREQRLRANEPVLARALRDARQPGQGWLLFVDQWEELYTLAEPNQRNAFDRQLALALDDHDCPLLVVGTVRSDYAHRLVDDLSLLAQLLNRVGHVYTLPQIGAAGLREVIRLPAEMAGLDVAEVEAAMLQEAADEPGALPLVSHALEQLWQVREPLPPGAAGLVARLSPDRLRDLGGLIGMLAASADSVLDRCEAEARRLNPKAKPGTGREAALELLLALTRRSSDGRHTRRRRTRDEAIIAAGNGDDKLGEYVLDILAGGRRADRPADAPGGEMRLIVVTAAVDRQAGDASPTSGAVPDIPLRAEVAYAAGAVEVDLIHETLVRSRRRSYIGNRSTTDDSSPLRRESGDNGATVPHWKALWDYIETHADRGHWQDRLDHAIDGWKSRKHLRRAIGLPGRYELTQFRKLLRIRRGSPQDKFLRFGMIVGRVRVAGLATFVVTWSLFLSGAPIDPSKWLALALTISTWHKWALGEVQEPQLESSSPPDRAVFTMGCKPGRDDNLGYTCNNGPKEKLSELIAPCRMAIYLVSNLDYRRFLYNRRGVSAVLSHALEESWALAGSQQPAVFVNWYDAKTYAEWLSNELIIVHPNRKHAIYRLPSSMEWEYSARNRMDDRMYPWGNSPAVDRALCSDCRTESDDQTSSIDQFKQTDSGIYSIVGNVTQWTSDAVNPMESADRLPTTKMVLRGGSLNTDASVLRAGIYSESGAIYQHSDGGFRVCRSSS